MRAKAAGEEVVHDDRHGERLGVFGALVHLLRRGCGNVQVMAFALAGLGLGLFHRLGDEVEALAPAHERLRVDVFVVLGEVQPAAQAFVYRAAVVLRRQAELGLDGAAQQRPAVFVHDVALDRDAVRRTAAGDHVGEGKAHVLEPQRPDRLEAEHVAGERSEHVDHRAFFEQVDGVGDEGVKAGRVARHVLDAVGAALVMVEIGQEIGPHCGPGAGGGLGRHRCRGLLARNALLRRDLETSQKVGVFHRIVRFPIGVPIVLDPGAVSAARLAHVCLRFESAKNRGNTPQGGFLRGAPRGGFPRSRQAGPRKGDRDLRRASPRAPLSRSVAKRL